MIWGLFTIILEDNMRIREGWGFILLAIWLILEGIIQLTSLSALGVIMVYGTIHPAGGRTIQPAA
jgi:hypothetical protein